MKRKSAVLPREPSLVAATTSSLLPSSISIDSVPLAYRICLTNPLRWSLVSNTCATCRNVSSAMALLEDMIRMFLLSHLIRCASISIRAKCVFPFCRAIRSRFVLRIQSPDLLTVSISLRTCSCHGSNGISMIVHKSLTSCNLFSPFAGGLNKRGFVAPRSFLLRAAMTRSNSLRVWP